MIFIRLFIAGVVLISFSDFSDKPVIQHSSVIADTIPSKFLGNFSDDYSINYSLNDSLFTQYPNVKYHILKWNLKEQYFIAKNDASNPSEEGLYSRIDYMEFTNMEPYGWGFCLTVYNATSDSLAEVQAIADRKNPKKGCGGFPFSRMKRIEKL